MNGSADRLKLSSAGLACLRGEHYISVETNMKECYARSRMADPYPDILIQMGLHCNDRYELAFPVQHHQQQQPNCQANLPDATQLNGACFQTHQTHVA
jgi:hypothetical protein